MRAMSDDAIMTIFVILAALVVAAFLAIAFGAAVHYGWL
jgi:hypothetical protein